MTGAVVLFEIGRLLDRLMPRLEAGDPLSQELGALWEYAGSHPERRRARC